MRRVRISVLMVLVLIVLAACAGQQLTKDQEARIALNAAQQNLATLFDTGKAYATANPTFQANWKAKVVPAFDVANKAVASALELAKKGQYTPADVQAKVMPLVNSVIALLGQYGVIK